MTAYNDSTPLSMGLTLHDDGIKDYSSLIKNKDMLIRFLTCMVESNRFEFICENNIQEFLDNIENHVACHEEHRLPFDSYHEYGVSAYGESYD